MIKTLGMIGGMGWESSALYYKLINKLVNKKLGGYSSCRCILNSVDFAEIEQLAATSNWEVIDKILSEAAINTQKAGAELLIVCSNTAHISYEAITASITIPFLHIAEPTGIAISNLGIKKVALLGTKYTMEKDFYRTYLYRNFDIEVITPDQNNRSVLNSIIFDELIHGEIKETSKKTLVNIINELVKYGAQGVILGCTEIPLLIGKDDLDLPIFDTTSLHAEMAVDLALK